jgi:hypothetical protein
MRAWQFLRAAVVTAALGSGCDGGGGSLEIAIDSIEPNQGPLGGGQTAVIHGSGFLAGGSAPDLALFGSVLTTQVSAISDSELQVVTPHGVEPGEVDVLIFNTNGYTISDGAYEYVAPPTITEVDAPSGHYKGGDEVTVVGSGFQEFDAGQATITFDGIPATNVRVQSDTEILAIVPAGTALHRATVAITNNRGAADKAEAYLYTGVGLLALSSRNDVTPGAGLYFVDLETGETSFVTAVDQTEAQIMGMSTDSDGTVYGSATHLNAQGQTYERSLYIFHPTAGSFEAVGSMAAPVVKGDPPLYQVPEVEFHDGTLYGFNRYDQGFGSIDTTTGLYTRIGDTGQGYCCGGAGLASDGDDLYFVTYNTMYRVELATGLLASPQVISGIPDYLRGWTYYDGALYAVQRASSGGGQKGLRGGAVVSRIIRVDLDDGPLVALPFATVPARIHALAVAPENPTDGGAE